MNLERYHLYASPDFVRFDFISEGPSGRILKTVLFTPLEENFFSLGFGDWDASVGEIDDLVETNNGDRDKVLSTVAAAVLEFTELYPTAIVYARGSTRVRTRLYQMSIARNWEAITPLFEVLGELPEGWEPFQPNKNYLAFLAMRK